MRLRCHRVWRFKITLEEASQLLSNWITQEPAEVAAMGKENVRGIIITSTPDDRIKYALLVSQGVSFYT